MRPQAVEPEPKAIATCGRVSRAQVVWAALFMGVSLGIGAVMAHLTLPPVLRYLLPVFCVLLGVAYFRAMFRDFRSSTDELQRQINLEAAVGACAGLYVAMVVYPVFRHAGIVGPLDPLGVLVLLIVLYAAGFLVAKRRYR